MQNNYAELKENIYGHKKRLDWIIKQINKHKITDAPTILDIGCGTGTMITLPIASLGYNITGLDIDINSIKLAQSLNHYENARFICEDIEYINGEYDFIIVSEVLEHVSNPDKFIANAHRLLKPSGILLITVPNGYGGFEIEQFITDKLFIYNILSFLKITWALTVIKQHIFHKYDDVGYPSTLSNSPHIQRFTLRKIRKLLNKQFWEMELDGSTPMAGKFTHLLFSGFGLPMKINNRLGSLLKRIAADYYICGVKLDK